MKTCFYVCSFSLLLLLLTLISLRPSQIATATAVSHSRGSSVPQAIRHSSALLTEYEQNITAGNNTWTTNGPPGGYIHALAIDPGSPNTIYAGTLDGGVFKSTNGGANWSQTSLINPSIFALAIDPGSPNTIYAGTIDGGGGVFKSTNGGANWNQFNTGLTNTSVLALAIDQSGQFLHAGTGGGGVFDYSYGSSNCALNCSAIVPASATANAPVSFLGTNNIANCAGSPTYEWDFGDNTPKSSLPNPKHTYSAAGSYTWKMTVSVSGATTCLKTGAITVTVACARPAITTQPASSILPPGARVH